MSSKRWAVVAAGILIAGVVAADVLRGQFASYDSFEATTLAGDRWRLDDYRGQQPVLVVFGATWCQPCHIEFPHIARLYGEYHDRGLEVVMVSTDDASTLKADPNFGQAPFPVLPNSPEIFQRWRAESLPYTVLLGRDGRVAAVYSGYSAGHMKNLEQRIAALTAG